MKILLVFLLSLGVAAAEVRIAPAPEGEELSSKFSVTIDGQPVPVYRARVAVADRELRMKGMDDKQNSALHFDEAAFVTFDFDGSATVEVTCPDPIETARILPASSGIEPTISGKSLRFDVSRPSQLTIEVNGRLVETLHVFANPPETDIPDPEDPNVIYFGPGIHDVDNLYVTSGKTIYIAAGAIIRGKVPPDKPQGVTFHLHGENITLRGRGIIDGSLAPIHSRHLILVQGKNVRIEGVILRDSSVWNLPIRESDHVRVENLKILGYRANSDGIDICNSRDVTVSDCFIRTLDDLIVVKTDKGKGKAERIVAKNCILWTEVAHALSIGAEVQEDIDDVLFTDCEVIHDLGREWTLRVFHCDAARISNIRFENIRIASTPRFISLWIDKAVWTRDEQRGHIDNVTFKNISVGEGDAKIELKGYDETHRIDGVRFEDVTIHGQPLRADQIMRNAFVDGVSVTP